MTALAVGDKDKASELPELHGLVVPAGVPAVWGGSARPPGACPQPQAEGGTGRVLQDQQHLVCEPTAACAGVHALAYPVGALFKVPHGLSNSLVLPEVIKFNSSHVNHLYVEIADLCFPELKNKKIEINDFILATYKLIEDLKIPKKLSEVGVSHNDIPKLARDAMKQERLLINNPVKIEYENAIKIYEATL